jgi:NTE family protein
MSDGAAIDLRTTEGRVDLVFKGGGVKGVALTGALAVLEERGFRTQNVAGTSAGAIVAVLHAAGYTAAELHAILATLDFTQFTDKGWEDRFPGLAGQGLSILLDQGIYEGTRFQQWVRELLEAKGKRTFRDLVHAEFADDPKYRYRCQVIASDVTGRRFLVLPQDATKLGLDPDDLEIDLAVRMSMSIPIFFEPVRFTHRTTGQEHLIVDGGMLSNFPVWLFDSEGEPEWPTFGLLLVDPAPNATLEAHLEAPPKQGGPLATVHYITSLVKTMLEAHDRMYLEAADYVRTVAIDNLGVGTTEFTLTGEKAEALYQSGREAATQFLDAWSFERYIEEYRTGKRHSRRAVTNPSELVVAPSSEAIRVVASEAEPAPES